MHSGGIFVKVLTISDFGGPEVLRVEERPDPVPAAGEVLIRVAASGVNRADLLQREGLYPPPAGAPAWPGLEVSGVIDAVGEGVTEWRSGDEVVALLAGGGYAEYCVAPVGQVLPKPPGLSFADGAALAEAACTVWSNLRAARAVAGETILIHGGSGGIGTLAIPIAKAAGLRVLTTARGVDRAARCEELGADVGIDYTTGDFAERAQRLGGADIVLDVLGAVYLEANLDALAVGGRLAIIGLQGGSHASIDLGTLLRKRATVLGTTLRSRPSAEKESIVADVRKDVWPWIPGEVRPTVGATFPLEDASAAHEAMESGEVFGKIVLAADGA